MLSSLVIIALLQSQDNLSAETLKWVEPLIQRLKKEGLLEGYYEGGGSRHARSLTRYEYAVATYATALQLIGVVQVGEKHGIKAEDQIVIAEWSRWAPACILTLTDEFKFELTSKGG